MIYKKNKNKYQILPLAIGLILLSASYYFASAADGGKESFQQTTSIGESLPPPAADTEELADPCDLKEVSCAGKDTPVARISNGSSLQAGVSSSGRIEAVISHYSAIDSCHTGASCLMANGKKAQIGYVACPRRYKLGIKVRIDGVEYICGDRTAQWVDGRWDIFMGYGIDAYHLALQNGLKTKIIEIL